MKHYLLLVLTCSLLLSCEQDFYIDNVDFTPQLVVNSLFTTDSDLEVFVNSSRNVLDSESSINDIDNANVVIKDASANIIATLDYMSEGRYLSTNANLEEGKLYTLEVTSEGFDKVTATSMIPTKVVAEIQNKNLVSTATSHSMNLDMRLMDNDVDPNYYVYEVVDSLKLHLSKEQPFKLETIQNVDILLTTDDENQDQIAANSLLQSRVFLKDETFMNAEYTINFKAKGNPAATGPVVLTSDVFSKQQMRVITASKNMYDY